MSEDRHGVSWMLEDYEALVKHVRDGMDDEALAAAVGRSLATVRQIARRLLPRDGAKRRSNLLALREALEDSDYDWQNHLMESYRAEGKPLWSKATDQMMKQAWATGSPSLPALATELDATEESTAKRMIERGIAPSTLELVDRLGCTPGGQIEMKARVARDDVATSVATLLVTNSRGDVLHAESHSAAHDFSKTLEGLELSQPGAEWVLVIRALGESEGRHRRGTFRNDDPMLMEPPEDPWGNPEETRDLLVDSEEPNPFDLPPGDGWPTPDSTGDRWS